MRDSSYSTGGSTGPTTPGTCSNVWCPPCLQHENVTAGYAGINDTRMSIFPGSAEAGLGIYIYIYIYVSVYGIPYIETLLNSRRTIGYPKKSMGSNYDQYRFADAL